VPDATRQSLPLPDHRETISRPPIEYREYLEHSECAEYIEWRRSACVATVAP
jgi:hypothetical protein